MDRWARIANELRQAVQDLDASRLDAPDALRITRTAAELGRLAEAAKALTARRGVRPRSTPRTRRAVP